MRESWYEVGRRLVGGWQDPELHRVRDRTHSSSGPTIHVTRHHTSPHAITRHPYPLKFWSHNSLCILKDASWVLMKNIFSIYLIYFWFFPSYIFGFPKFRFQLPGASQSIIAELQQTQLQKTIQCAAGRGDSKSLDLIHKTFKPSNWREWHKQFILANERLLLVFARLDCFGSVLVR